MLENPFALMRRLTDEMDRAFGDFRLRNVELPLPAFPKAADWMPAIEVLEKPDKLVLKAELPGLTKDDVKIDVTEEALVLQGERKAEKTEKGEDFVRTERSYGKFYRRIPLPEEAKIAEAKANFKNGVLEIEVPVVAKKAIAPRRLEIEEGAVKEKAKTAA